MNSQVPIDRSGSAGNKCLDFVLQREANIPLLHLVFGAFTLFTLFMAFHHVPWRDEATPWIFGRELSWRELFFMTRHNGHPLLWFLCVKGVQAAGSNYLGMMVLNWAFCVAGIGLLFYGSALPLVARIGFALTPVCVGEIAFTARDYAIALPICFLAAVLYRTVRERPLRFALVLAILPSTNVFAAAVFVGIWFQFLLDQGYDSRAKTFSWRPLLGKYFGANLILLMGALLLVLQLAPIRFDGDSYPGVAAYVEPDFARLLHSHVLLVLAAPLAWMLLPKKAPRIVGGLVTVLLSCVPAIAYGAGARHLFMIAMGVTYFGWTYLDSFLAADSPSTQRWGVNGVKVAVCGLILLAAFGAKPDKTEDVFNRPFDARRAAQAITQAGLDRPGTLMVANDPFRMMTLFLFLDSIQSAYVPPQFGPSPQRFATASAKDFRESPDLAEIEPLAVELARNNPNKTILIVAAGATTSRPYNPPGYHLTAIYQTPLSPRFQRLDEAYSLYVLRLNFPGLDAAVPDKNELGRPRRFLIY